MKVDMIGIVTTDIKKSLVFYQLLGFQPLTETTPEYIELANEGVRLSLNASQMVAGVYGYEPKTVGDTIELAFICETTEEVAAYFKKVKQAGYEVVREPFHAFWGQYYAVVKDPDGHIISLFSNISQELAE